MLTEPLNEAWSLPPDNVNSRVVLKKLHGPGGPGIGPAENGPQTPATRQGPKRSTPKFVEGANTVETRERPVAETPSPVESVNVPEREDATSFAPAGSKNRQGDGNKESTGSPAVGDKHPENSGRVGVASEEQVEPEIGRIVAEVELPEAVGPEDRFYVNGDDRAIRRDLNRWQRDRGRRRHVDSGHRERHSQKRRE